MNTLFLSKYVILIRWKESWPFFNVYEPRQQGSVLFNAGETGSRCLWLIGWKAVFDYTGCGSAFGLLLLLHQYYELLFFAAVYILRKHMLLWLFFFAHWKIKQHLTSDICWYFSVHWVHILTVVVGPKRGFCDCLWEGEIKQHFKSQLERKWLLLSLCLFASERQVSAAGHWQEHGCFAPFCRDISVCVCVCV